jgi:hypothetical protein
MKVLTMKELEEAMGLDKQDKDENISFSHKVKRTLFTSTQHNRDLLMVNEIIGGNFGATTSSLTGFYVPDIIKEDLEFELELLGRGRINKFKKKWLNKRYDGKVPKARILIISIRKELKELFDKVYVVGEIENIKSLKQKNKQKVIPLTG